MALKEQHFLSNLTPLRGIAALLVVTFHFVCVFEHFIDPKSSMFFAKCYLMVDLFFIMSGFIIYHVYGGIFKQSINKSDWLKYMRARIARIYPLHIITLFVCVILFQFSPVFIPGVDDPKGIPVNIFMLQSFGVLPIFTFNVPAWSVSAEFFAYLLFPIIALGIQKRKLLFIPMILLLITCTYYILAFKLSHAHDAIVIPNLDITYDYGYLRGAAGFFLGVLFYQFYQNKYLYFLRKDFVVIALILLTCWALHANWVDLILIPLFAFLILSLAYNSGKIKNQFNKKWMQWLGDVSFSVYMIHVPLMFLMTDMLPYVGITYTGLGSVHLPRWEAGLWCASFLGVTLFISGYSYKFIEKPMRKLINEKMNPVSLRNLRTVKDN